MCKETYLKEIAYEKLSEFIECSNSYSSVEEIQAYSQAIIDMIECISDDKNIILLSESK